MSRRTRTNAFVLLGYVVVAFAYFGWRLVPHPGRYILGAGLDPQIFIWAFAWWPHAVANLQNPFYTHEVYAPVRDQPRLDDDRARPRVRLLAADAPVRARRLLQRGGACWRRLCRPGPAFLLCRHLTEALWPSLVGGYLFGFSSYELGEELGHLGMTSVFLVPLVALAHRPVPRG